MTEDVYVQLGLTVITALLMGMHSKCLVMVVGLYDTITLLNLKCHGN